MVGEFVGLLVGVNVLNRSSVGELVDTFAVNMDGEFVIVGPVGALDEVDATGARSVILVYSEEIIEGQSVLS